MITHNTAGGEAVSRLQRIAKSHTIRSGCGLWYNEAHSRAHGSGKLAGVSGDFSAGLTLDWVAETRPQTFC